VTTLLAGAALRLPRVATASVALVGAGYGIVLVVDGRELDLRAPVLATGLLVVAELVLWGHERRVTSPDEPGLAERHVTWLAVLALGSLALGTGLLSLAEVVRAQGIAVDAAGAIAAVAALTLLLVAREPRR